MPEKEISPGPKKILLSGGTGFLGSHVSRRLVNEGHDVTILKRTFSSLNRINDLVDKLRLVNTEDFTGGEYDLFINAASNYGRTGESEEEMLRANTEFPLEILRKIEREPLHLININTSLPSSMNLYANSKHLFIEKFRTEFPTLTCTNLLVEQFYGPGDGTFISFLVNNLKSDKKEIKLTLGEQKRDFIYYEDVVEAIVQVSKHLYNGDIQVGTGQGVLIKDVVKKLVSELSADLNRINFGGLEYRKNEVMNSIADISSIKELGWEPKVFIDEGIKKVVENL